MMDKTEILQYITDKVDPDDLVDRLGFSTEDLMERLKSDVLSNLHLFADLLEDDEE
jgi:hypothetical protein